MIVNDSDKNKIFSRRVFVLVFVKAFFIACLVFRLIYLQIFKHGKYNTLSASNRIKSFIIPPLRGKIMDRKGDILASNSEYYRILFNPEAQVSIQDTIKKLSKLIKEPTSKFIYDSSKNIRKSTNGYILLYDDLSWAQVAKIEVHTPELPGVYIETAQRRFYPHGATTANFLGYVAAVSEKEIKQTDNNLLSHPDFKIGKMGIEKKYEEHLRGKAGLSHLEVDAYGFGVRNVDLTSSLKSTAGANLELAIDISLQKFCHDLVKEQRASVVMLDIQTGEILTLISQPSFDSNLFVAGIPQNKWHELISDPGKPMTNKAISNVYPPGSTFKNITALAALEDGFNPKKKITCKGKTRLGRRIFHCWRKEGHGTLDLVDALKQSCNVYFYHVAKEVGIAKIVATARKLGLGSITNIELNNEKAGHLPTMAWKKKIFNIPWVTGDTYNSGIGQGFLETTPLQLAVMTARIASGKEVSPTILKKAAASNFPELDFAPENLTIIRKALFKAVNEKRGTAYYRRIANKKFAMAGKTGTAQVVSVNHDKEDFDKLDIKERNHGLFVGYAPFDKPRYAVSVVVEHGGSGSTSAAPIARDLLYFAQKQEIKNKT